MFGVIKEVISIVSFLIILAGTSSLALQKTYKWIKRESLVEVYKGLSPLSPFTKALTTLSK